MTDPGALPDPRERPGYNEASSTRPTEPASRSGAGRLASSPDADDEVAVPELTHGNAEEHDDRAPRAAEKSVARKSGDPQERKDGERHLDSKPAERSADARHGGTTASGVHASKPKRVLYHEAKEAGIEGRSAMNKEQLVEALHTHRATSSSREPETRKAPTPGRRNRSGRASPPKRQPELTEVGSAHVRPAADARGPNRCAIVYKRQRRYGEFQVVVTEKGGSRKPVARSPGFRAPRFGATRQWGAARVAHELLVSRLAACGWWSVNSGGAWHEVEFVRARPAGMRTRRSLVTVVREAGHARFVAEELDAYGNPAPLMLSAPFRAHRFLPVRPSRQARRSLDQLVARMESEGWRVATAVGKNWYAISLWRPVSANGGPRVGSA